MQKARRGFCRIMNKAKIISPKTQKIAIAVVHGVNREVERI